MSELRQRGFVVTEGPFSFIDIAGIAKGYDRSFVVAPDGEIKRGRTSTRWGGLVALEPFYRIFLNSPLLSAAAERIGGPMKLSSFCARTLVASRRSRTAASGCGPRRGRLSASRLHFHDRRIPI